MGGSCDRYSQVRILDGVSTSAFTTESAEAPIENNRPPPFGSLRSVVPVQQSQKRGPWRLTLICLEIWDNCWAANFAIDRDPRGPEDEFFYPYLTLEAISEGSQRYVSGFGGSYGGGRFDSGQHHRQLVPFVPIIDLISESVRLEARLQLSHPGNRSTLHDAPDWEDPAPSVFEIPRIGANGLPSAKPLTPSHEAPSIPRPPYDLGAPLWVVPVEAEQTIGDWTVTIVSATCAPTVSSWSTAYWSEPAYAPRRHGLPPPALL